jgi:cell division protease FtsH
MSSNDAHGPDRQEKRGLRPWPQVLLFWAGLLFLYLAFGGFLSGWDRAELPYTEFEHQLESDNVARVHVRGQEIQGEFREPYAPIPDQEAAPEAEKEEKQSPTYERFETTVPSFAEERLAALLDRNDVVIAAESDSASLWQQLLVGLLPLVFIVALIWYGARLLQRRAASLGGPGGAFGLGRSRARRFNELESRTTFADVAGLEGAKRDMQQVIDFLRDPWRYRELGAKLPRGVLLMGPPGTGKTLLARAVAGEARVPFFSISGSEFIETFVGVGAARVRSMLEEAKKEAPSVVFIDEIDSVGRSRGAGLGGGHDEREQTLNQILSEMDGFTPHQAVVVLAATNRPDVLDPALLRPGRFDRKVLLDLPRRNARRRILEVHTRQVPMDEDVELESIVAATVGFSGADLENLVNEAALLAGREEKKEVSAAHFDRARDRIVLGSEREELFSEKERRRAAFHESGHALLAAVLPLADPLRKVTIIPRGRGLGATEQIPDEAILNRTRAQLCAQITVMLGGRTAERVAFGEMSSGAADDLDRATKLARRMVTEFGMSERLGAASFRYGEEHVFLGKELSEPRQFSEHTAQLIDEEICAIIREGEVRALEVLSDRTKVLETLAEALLDRESLEQHEIEAMLECAR